MTTERDPIARLVQDIEREGKPSLQWTLEWETRGARAELDPVHAAWAVSTDATAMLCFLVYSCGLDFARPLSLTLFGMRAQVAAGPHREPRIVVFRTLDPDAIAKDTITLLTRGVAPADVPPALRTADPADAAAVRAAVPYPPTLGDVLTPGCLA